MRAALSRPAPAPAAAPQVLKIERLWSGPDAGFGDIAACDDYYVEKSAQPPRIRRKVTPARGPEHITR